MKRLLLSFILAFVISPSFATPVNVSLTLNSIHSIVRSEKSGDEVYLNILVHDSKGNAMVKKIPKPPLHWNSNSLPNVKNLNLWSAVLDSNQSSTLTLTVMESDTPPWNPDDSLGSITLVLKNTDGVLQHQWSIKHGTSIKLSKDSDPIEKTRFTLTEKNSRYVLDVSLARD